MSNSADVAKVRAKLARLTKRCDDSCSGWGVFSTQCSSRVPDGTLELQRCDDCWSGVDDPLTDVEIELLPEAQAELKKTIERMHVEEHGTCYGMFAEWCPHCLAQLSWLKSKRRAA